MEPAIHPTAVIHRDAELGAGVKVGPYAVVGAGVAIGDGTEVGAHCRIEGPTTLGRDNHLHGHCCVGLAPQDLKYAGEPTRLEIGDRNQIREFVTINRGTPGGGGVTRLGSDNLLMTGTHIGHDCQVGDHVVFANSGTLAGHVEVRDWAGIGAFSAVHQFSRVGQHAYVGGFTVVILDVLPFSITVGQKARCVGVNRIGLGRRGYDRAAVTALERAFRILLRSGHNTTQALELLRAGHSEQPLVAELIEFVQSSERGITKTVRKGNRGAGD